MFDLNKEDTIVALATPPGVGAISVIRLSGPKAIISADAIFSCGIQLEMAKSHTIHYGKIEENGETIDDVLISIFRSPNSYTGEDCVEISSHGSPLIVKTIISLLLRKGDIRTAEPGEFTKRAFLNNKMNLTQAEAVADVINSRTIVSLRGARSQLDGLLSSKVDQIRNNLIDISSYLELELDFAEENLELIKREVLIKKIEEIIKEINSLLDSYSFGKVIKEGLNVVIVGEPNVGKSSLLNYLLKESRAIVSSIPGTTRDTIKEEISINGLLFKIIDTAGLRTAGEEIEIEGVKRTKTAVKDADLILFVGDVLAGFSPLVEQELLELNPKAKIIRIINKIDLLSNIKIFSDFEISVKNGIGLNNLVKGLREKIVGESAYSEKDVIITNLRHYNCLERSKKFLEKAITTANEKFSGEFLASDLRVADLALAEIIGIITPDEILNNIFSKFCVGK